MSKDPYLVAHGLCIHNLLGSRWVWSDESLLFWVISFLVLTPEAYNSAEFTSENSTKLNYEDGKDVDVDTSGMLK